MELRQKQPSGASTRTVEAACSAGVRCEIAAPGGHMIVTDEAEDRGGANAGPSPLALLTASLASCQMVQIVKVAEAMRFSHGPIAIRASTTTDRVAGVEGNDKVMRFTGAELVIDVETAETPERIARLKALPEDRCPVGNLFADANAAPVFTWNVTAPAR